MVRHHLRTRHSKFTPCHTQCPIPVSDLQPHRCTIIHSPNDLEEQQCDKWTEPSHAHEVVRESGWTGRTVFQLRPEVDLTPFTFQSDTEVSLMQWSPKQHRQLLAQLKERHDDRGTDQPYHVIEVFSPPRFALECSKQGWKCLSADLCTGWDFRRIADRQKMKDILEKNPPELLVLCPPCTWAGGWFHLNKHKMNPEEVREKERLTHLFINFCRELIDIQLKHHKRVMFEHPKSSIAWQLLQKHLTTMIPVDLHMCCYRMGLPGGDLIRKATRLLVSHADMEVLARTCPGANDHRHRVHQTIAGSHPSVGSISKFAGQYAPAFVKAVLDTVKELPRSDVLIVQDSIAECLVASRLDELNAEDANQVIASIKKLHQNLGHPPNNQLVRVLQHGGASSEAIRCAREFKCAHCDSQVRPRPALPGQTHRVTEFNALVGVDIKYLNGWKTNQKVPAVNMIDYASSLQIVVPLFQSVTSEAIKTVIMERWVAWAGMPTEVIVDPAKPNLSDAFTVPLEISGSTTKITAADAHWQLGKTEVHGGWFGRVLDKVISDQCPQNREEWVDCVHASHCKNQLIQVYGMTPSQFVFGKNPRIAENLLDEPLEVIPATASLYESAVAKQVAIRQSARKAVLELQDSKTLRLALAARPRVQTVFQPGSHVAYWRSQKWSNGVLDNTCRWHGPATVLGYVGRNLVIIHKRQIFRCAPEQVRPSTCDELKLLETPEVSLLGIKGLIEEGKIQSKQYIDLAPETYPTIGDAPIESEPAQPSSEPPLQVAVPQSVAEMNEPRPEESPELLNEEPENNVAPASDPEIFKESETVVESPESTSAKPEAEPSSYGPAVRRRIPEKSGPFALYRPARLSQEDFTDLMREVVPRLIEDVVNQEESSKVEESQGTKRELEVEDSGSSASSSKQPRTRSPDSSVLSVSVVGETFAVDEAAILSVECLQNMDHPGCENLTTDEVTSFRELFEQGSSSELLLAQYIQKKASKEIRGTGNPPAFQAKVDEAKLLEWNTITGKSAARIVYGQEAATVRRKHSDRIMGSRYVITVKQEDDAPERVKARWCLQGYLDPDLGAKAESGDLQSPTLSQVGRNILFQLIASHGWKLQLGDIKGAFLAAGDLPAHYRPLYARLPPGGIPGVPEDALIEVLGHVYGLNDSPSAWYKKLSSVLTQAGFEKSQFDNCLFYMRENDRLTGIYGVHVDDCATGGHGEKYQKALAYLKSHFEFRKWRDGNGEFCGAMYDQCQTTFQIRMSQEKFTQKLRPIHFTRERLSDRQSTLNPKEISCLRAVNGSLNWLSTQSRPDLAAQVSFSQQSFPEPCINDALAANHAVRRAKQHADQSIVFQNIPPEELAIMCHSDAAFGNAKAGATQAGYVISLTSKKMDQGLECPWTPVFWKSTRLPRLVSSTLSAEAQSMSLATSMCEWISLVLTEALDGKKFSHSYWNKSNDRCIILATDCKSLYDHLFSQSAPTLDDRRTAIDIIIIRDSIKRLQASLRWLPTDRMLADAMTKESPDAFDLLRACIRESRYQISSEKTILDLRSKERERRKSFVQKNAPCAP